MSYTSTLIRKTNSAVSYPDVLGLYLGRSRFLGEDNASFLSRLYTYSTKVKDTSLQGIINNINSELNLNVTKAISISQTVPTVIALVPGQLIVGSTIIPLFNIGADTYIEWLMLSDVVTALNQIVGTTAQLLVPDQPTLVLCKQTNINTTFNETIESGTPTYTVLNSGLISDSLLFSGSTPSYTVSGDTITFLSSPSSQLSVIYQNVIQSFNLISSQVNVIGLTEPSFIQAGTSSADVLGYQIKEAIQEIMNADRSYWTD